MPSLNQLKSELRKLANPAQAEILQRFFKTGKGEYAQGQKCLGISMPNLRKIASKYQDLNLEDLQNLFKPNIQDYRLVTLVILILKNKKADQADKKKIYNFYIKNAPEINNWSLVDISAPHIVGEYLLDKPRDILYRLARSKNLWKKRIAILSTFRFIRAGEFKDALEISKILLRDKHDLIHKAVGWMLREVGNRDQKEEEKFLNKHIKQMPRTMLRYAIEKFPETKRRFYLKK